MKLDVWNSQLNCERSHIYSCQTLAHGIFLWPHEEPAVMSLWLYINIIIVACCNGKVICIMNRVPGIGLRQLHWHHTVVCDVFCNVCAQILLYLLTLVLPCYFIIFIIKINDKGPKPLTCHNKNIKSQISVYSLW